MAFLFISYSHLNVFNIPKHVKITVFLHFEFLHLMTLTLTFTLNILIHVIIDSNN